MSNKNNFATEVSQMEYGLVGENLSHSYSKIIHEKFGLYKYALHSVSLSELKNVLKCKNFKGLNVTIPYKKAVIPFCDNVDITAKRIGSVNTLIVDAKNTLTGYNTDYFGLKYTINRSNISLKNKKVLILGDGGTCATAQALATDLQAKEILIVSINGVLNYKNVYEHLNTDIIINTTPVGMYPNNGEKLINIAKFKNLSGVIDVIYNPFYTSLILEAKKHKIPVAGGLPMLIAQAKTSAELFKNIKLDDSLIERIIKELVMKLSNIIFIGMPGSGKTTVGRAVAKKLERKFIDIDFEIEKTCQMKIPEIFQTYGEKEFRKIECNILKNYGKMNSLVISTGGGAVLNIKNHLYLTQNGRIYWINKDLNLLETKGRPLSKNLNELQKMYQIRKPLYEIFSNKVINNNSFIESTIQQILDDFYENTCY